MSRLTQIATLVVMLAVALLRAIGNESWQPAFAVALSVLGVRMIVMAWSATRGELPWLRLLLPGIILLEGVGLAWRGSDALWHERLGIAVMLELAFVVVSIRELRRTAVGIEPLETRIARALEALLPPRLARFVAVELVIVGSALRFIFGGWRREVPAGFTYHRESALRLLLMFLPLLAIGDVLFVEIVLLPHAAMWLRVLVHVAAIYGLIWLIGLYASLRERPHQLAGGRLTLHRGILGRLDVSVAEIASINELPSFADDWKKLAYKKGAIRIDVAGASILELRLRTPLRRVGVFGDGAASTRVLVAVDEPAPFTAAIEGAR